MPAFVSCSVEFKEKRQPYFLIKLSCFSSPGGNLFKLFYYQNLCGICRRLIFISNEWRKLNPYSVTLSCGLNSLFFPKRIAKCLAHFQTLKRNTVQTLSQNYWFKSSLTLFRMGFFGTAHEWVRRGGCKKVLRPLKSVTHILQ